MGNMQCCDICYSQKVNGFTENQNLSPGFVQTYEPSVNTIDSSSKYVSNEATPANSNNQAIDVPSVNPKQGIGQRLKLSIDTLWVDNMKAEGHDIIQIYQRFDNDRVRRTKTAELNKVQLLFNEVISKQGWSYFVVTILSYIPSQGFQFVMGLADCLQARQRLHIWMLPCQQGCNFTEQKVLGVQEKHKKAVECHLKLVLAVSLQDGLIRYYRQSVLVKQQKIRPELLEEGVKIVPYIQTFKRGVEFHWERQPINATINQEIFVIEQENSFQSLGPQSQ